MSPDQVIPAIVVLHGDHGLSRQYVEIAHVLSVRAGAVEPAAGRHDGAGPDVDTSDLTSICCPFGPDFVGATPSA